MYRIILCACFLFSLSACDLLSPESGLQKNEGTVISTDISTDFSNLIWSQNSDEIFVAGKSGLLAIHASAGTVRSIDKSGSVFNSALSSDGKWIYYFLGNSLFNGIEPLNRIRFDGTNKQLLLSNSLSLSLVISTDSTIAHRKLESDSLISDSLFIFSLNGKADRGLTLGSIPITFSNDGVWLLYADASMNCAIISVKNREVQNISHNMSEFGGNFRWDSDGLKVVYHGISGTFYKNFTTNIQFKITENVNSPQLSKWSPDGKKIAYWTNECLESKGFGCAKMQYVLHMVDIDTKKENIIAVHNPETIDWYVGSIAFSPNNKNIAYVVGSRIYKKDIP